MCARTACGLLLLVLLGCAGPARQASKPQSGLPVLEPVTCGSIERLHKYGEFYLGSQPATDDFAALKQLGVTTIINLRHEDEFPALDEAKIVADLGLAYVRVPWSGPTELTDQVFDEIRSLLKSVEGRALVHCGSGNRVGAVWLPWRVLDCGLSWDHALAEAQLVGLTSSELEAKARDYIARKAEANEPGKRTQG